MLGITDGQGDVCPVSCTLCSVPSASQSPSARGKCLAWALKGRSSQKGGTGARLEPAPLPQPGGCSHQPVAGLPPLQNGGRHRAKSHQVLHGC